MPMKMRGPIGLRRRRRHVRRQFPRPPDFADAPPAGVDVESSDDDGEEEENGEFVVGR